MVQAIGIHLDSQQADKVELTCSVELTGCILCLNKQLGAP